MDKSSQLDKLMELKQLYEQGILTKEEMEVEKKKILGESSKEEHQPSIPSQPEIENPSVDIPKEANNVIDEKESFFQKYKTYIFVGLGLLIAGSIYLFYSNVMEKEIPKPPTPAEQIGQIEADLDNTELDNLIADIFKLTKEKSCNELIKALGKDGFKQEGSDDEYTSAKWSRVYRLGNSGSDSISVYWEKIRESVFLSIYCSKEAVMNKWIEDIKKLGYSLSDSSEGGDKILSFSKNNDEGGLIQYYHDRKEISIVMITNFHSITDSDMASSDKKQIQDDSYEYNFTGMIDSFKKIYSFKMALNIDDNGNVSGYYIVTNGANEPVLLRGQISDWANTHEGEIILYEFDRAKNSKTGYYFQGDFNVEYSNRGTFAGYSMSGSYTNAEDIDWPFKTE